LAITSEFYYPSADGKHQVFAKEWAPDDGTPKAVVQIVHGLAEYIERYDAFARYLADHGYLVTGEDHLGHGKTAADGQYGFFAEQNGWKLVAHDIRKLRELQGEKHGDLPYFMLGHSLGSFFTRLYLIQWPGTVTGAIISGTGQISSVMMFLSQLLIRRDLKKLGAKTPSTTMQKLTFQAYNKQFAPNRTEADWISRDEKVVDAYMADPLCQFPPTVGLSRDTVDMIQFISSRTNLRKMDLQTPIYFFSGALDPTGDSGDAVRRVYGFFKKAGCTDVSLKLYPEGRHEMLNEINREEVYADTLAWLENYV